MSALQSPLYVEYGLVPATLRTGYTNISRNLSYLSISLRELQTINAIQKQKKKEHSLRIYGQFLHAIILYIF